LGGRVAVCGSAVSIQALISGAANRMYRVRSVPEEETIAEGTKFRGGLAFEKADEKRDIKWHEVLNVMAYLLKF
jgi:hypothetical protein